MLPVCADTEQNHGHKVPTNRQFWRKLGSFLVFASGRDTMYLDRTHPDLSR